MTVTKTPVAMTIAPGIHGYTSLFSQQYVTNEELALLPTCGIRDDKFDERAWHTLILGTR